MRCGFLTAIGRASRSGAAAFCRSAAASSRRRDRRVSNGPRVPRSVMPPVVGGTSHLGTADLDAWRPLLSRWGTSNRLISNSLNNGPWVLPRTWVQIAPRLDSSAMHARHTEQSKRGTLPGHRKPRGHRPRLSQGQLSQTPYYRNNVLLSRKSVI